MHERHRKRGQKHKQRDKWAPCREPDVELDPGSPGSRPGLQAALNRCATGAAPSLPFKGDKIGMKRLSDVQLVLRSIWDYF